jgi:hypothetical protein
LRAHERGRRQQVEIVYKDGVGYDPKELVDSVTGTVGLN